jgi:hydrogenase expression/formation protein HypC
MCLAVPGEVLDIDGDKDDLRRSGRVSFGGVVRRVNFAYVPEVQVGDYVNVHVGFALSVVDATEAQRVFAYLDEIDRLD